MVNREEGELPFPFCPLPRCMVLGYLINFNKGMTFPLHLCLVLKGCNVQISVSAHEPTVPPTPNPRMLGQILPKSVAKSLLRNNWDWSSERNGRVLENSN